MNPLRVRPILFAAVGGALIATASVYGTLVLVSEVTGRRDERAGAVLTDALRSTARLEHARLLDRWTALSTEIDAVLARHLARMPAATPQVAVPWIPGMCAAPVPAGVVRLGIVDTKVHAPLMFVEFQKGRCVDVLGALGVESLVGPPFPSGKEVARLATIAGAGLDDAPGERAAIVMAMRDGVAARVRLARRAAGRVAFADVDLGALGTPPGVDARLDALLLVDGVPAGYVHGGPRPRGLPDALKGVKTGATRALDLPSLAEASAARAVLAWLDRSTDDGSLAIAAAQEALPAALHGVSLLVVASAPWPAASNILRARLAAFLVAIGAAWTLLLLLSLRRLSRALWKTAQDVRTAWLGLRDDDEGSAEDRRRALQLLDTLADRTEETLAAAYGGPERFWAPGPIKRLLGLLRKQLAREK